MNRGKQTIKVVLSAILAVAWMAFMFGMSGADGDTSGGFSDAVSRLLASVFVSGWDSMDASGQLAIISSMSFPVRKAAHFSEYAFLCLLLVNLVWQVAALLGRRRAVWACVLIGLACTVAFAFTDEFHQSFVPGRAPQLFDVGVDSCGAALAAVLALPVLRRFQRR